MSTNATATGTIAETLTDDELETLLAERRKKKEAEQRKRREQYEAHRNEAVTALCVEAGKLADLLGYFHQQAYTTLEDLGQRLAEYGDLRGNSKGGYSATSDDARYKVAYTHHAIGEWDERADKAEELLRDFMGDTIKKRDKVLHDIIMSLLARNNKGKLEYGRIQTLYQYEDRYEDTRWREAIRLLKESYRVIGSKFYIEFSERNALGNYEPIQLNFSRLAPVEAAEANA